MSSYELDVGIGVENGDDVDSIVTLESKAYECVRVPASF